MEHRLHIEAKTHTDKERAVIATIQTLLETYALPIFTDNSIVEQGAVPHSHPVLTLNTRNSDPLLILQIFLHEQFHWFADELPQYKGCIEYLKENYVDLGDCNKTGSNENSFWEHLIVCWNTRNILQDILKKDEVDFIYSEWQPYPLTEKFVEGNFGTLKNDLQGFDAAYSQK